MAALGFDVAATLIQKRVRGRRTRQRYLLQQLAFLVQSHYRDPHARIDAVDLACALGAVRRLEGRLWKRSSQFPKYQERQVWVDDLQLKYSVRSGDPKTIDLAQIDQIVIHSEDRREFALCTRNGRSYTFRRKRQQASEALDSARAKAGTVLNFIPAFSYFSTEAITCIVIYRITHVARQQWSRTQTPLSNSLESNVLRQTSPACRFHPPPRIRRAE